MTSRTRGHFEPLKKVCNLEINHTRLSKKKKKAQHGKTTIFHCSSKCWTYGVSSDATSLERASSLLSKLKKCCFPFPSIYHTYSVCHRLETTSDSPHHEALTHTKQSPSHTHLFFCLFVGTGFPGTQTGLCFTGPPASTSGASNLLNQCHQVMF